MRLSLAGFFLLVPFSAHAAEYKLINIGFGVSGGTCANARIETVQSFEGVVSEFSQNGQLKARVQVETVFKDSYSPKAGCDGNISRSTIALKISGTVNVTRAAGYKEYRGVGSFTVDQALTSGRNISDRRTQMGSAPFTLRTSVNPVSKGFEVSIEANTTPGLRRDPLTYIIQPAMIPTSKENQGDANFDCKVDIEDLNLVRNSMGNSGPFVIGDVDGSGRVELEDLNAVRNNLGAQVCQ
jgi:hypothetical protein